MYTPPTFKSDRAASLAFAEARGFGTVCAWDGKQADRLVTAVLSRPLPMTARRARVPRCASQSAGKARGRDIVLAARRERRGCLCLAGLVRLARSGADLAVSGGAPDRPGADNCPTDELVAQIDTLSAKFENRLAPKKPWTVVEDDGRAAGSDEEGDRGSCDDGRGGRGQLQAEPAQIRGRLRRCGDGACAASRMPARTRSRS